MNNSVTLKEVFGQELETYLYTQEAQEKLVDRNLFDFESIQQHMCKGFENAKDSLLDPFFSEVSPEEFSLDTEDLLEMSVLMPYEALENYEMQQV